MEANHEEKLIKKMKSHQHSRIEITNKKITKLKAKMGWKGVGTQNDPIIIDDLSGLKPNLWIHLSSLHYVIRNVIIYKLMCINTQNITIENCKIHELEVEGCYNMKIKNNSIIWFKFVYSKGCVLENNFFSNESLERLENNYFDKLYPKIRSGMYAIAVVFALVATSIVWYSRYLWFLSLLAFSLVGLIFYYIHTLKAKYKRTYDKPENILLGNSSLIGDAQQEIFHKILENYAHLGINWFRGYIHVFIGIPFGVTVGIILSMILYF